MSTQDLSHMQGNPTADMHLPDAAVPTPDPFAEYDAGIPAEPVPGSVVAFTIFVNDEAYRPITAMRAVVRGQAGKQWYCSGPAAPRAPLTWDALLDLVGEDRWSTIRIVTTWGTL